MSAPGVRLGLLGATGAVGEEILRVLEERRFPIAELLLFASEASVGVEVEFRGELLYVEPLDSVRAAGCDLVLCAAPGALPDLLPALRERRCRVVDLSGALELDPEVPLFLPGAKLGGRDVAVPRGVVAGLAIALAPLAGECGLERLTVTTLESASTAGRRGLDALRDQTVRVLSSMSGDEEQAGVFPQMLAFDCLPVVGEISEGDETFEERRLRHVLRRVLTAPALPVEVMRIRVPTFMGALASVHARLAKELTLERAGALWRETRGVRLLPDPELPTPRGATAHEDVAVGRVRFDRETCVLSFAIALDTLRRGAALGAVEAAESLVGG